MRIKSVKYVIALLALCVLPSVLVSSDDSEATEGISTGLGSVDTLMARYSQWQEEEVQRVGEGNISIPVGLSRVFSSEYVEAFGNAKINIASGQIAVEIKGLPAKGEFDVWIVDNDPNSSVLPEEGDKMLRLGSLRANGNVAQLETTLDSETVRSLDPDIVAVTRAGQTPAEGTLVAGNMTLFQEFYFNEQQGRGATLNDAPAPITKGEQAGLLARLASAVFPTASADIGPITDPTVPNADLITAGRQSFFFETFQGNGRTCGTCHREDNNLTIEPNFIGTLPIEDPLFAAETQAALFKNFENPVLMRNFGLILENLDGFDQLATKFVMRGIPHTLALLDNTLTPGNDTQPPNQRTGWSGDGAPVGNFLLFDGTAHSALGTLEDFIIGAIFQHYPRTLARRPFSSPGLPFDFRLPTQAELDSLEAFMRSTGRRLDPNLAVLRLRGVVPARGQAIFNNPGTPGVLIPGEGKCVNCHNNAGASAAFAPGTNFNFNTGVENLPDHPADLAGQPNPADGGFGAQVGPCPPGGCGNGNFNTPVLVEAADTGPFFHNNAVDTIEAAVDFYNSAAFQASPSGAAVSGIRLEATQVFAVGAFLRVLNALENIRSAGDIEKRAKLGTLAQGRELIRLSIAELTDALQVLSAANLHPVAQNRIRQAITKDNQASATTTLSTRNTRLDEALALKLQAVNDMVITNVPAFQF